MSVAAESYKEKSANRGTLAQQITYNLSSASPNVKALLFLSCCVPCTRLHFHLTASLPLYCPSLSHSLCTHASLPVLRPRDLSECNSQQGCVHVLSVKQASAVFCIIRFQLRKGSLAQVKRPRGMQTTFWDTHCTAISGRYGACCRTVFKRSPCCMLRHKPAGISCLCGHLNFKNLIRH